MSADDTPQDITASTSDPLTAAASTLPIGWIRDSKPTQFAGAPLLLVVDGSRDVSLSLPSSHSPDSWQTTVIIHSSLCSA